MATNGKPGSVRPRIEVLSAAEPAEAAAVAAAIEQFIADTAPAPAPPAPAPAWQRAALREGVGAKAIFGPPDPNRSDRWQ